MPMKIQIQCLLLLACLFSLVFPIQAQTPQEILDEPFPFCYVHEENWNGVTGTIYTTVHISRPAFGHMKLRHPQSYEGECKEPARFDFCIVYRNPQLPNDNGTETVFNGWRQWWNYHSFWYPNSYQGKCKGDSGSASPPDSPNKTPIRVNQCGLGVLPQGYAEWTFEFRGRTALPNGWTEDIWYSGKVGYSGDLHYSYPYGDYPANDYPPMTNQDGLTFTPFVALAVFLESSHVYDVVIDTGGQCYLVIDPTPNTPVPIAPRLGAPFVVFDFADTDVQLDD